MKTSASEKGLSGPHEIGVEGPEAAVWRQRQSQLLAKSAPDTVALVAAAPVQRRSADTHFPYRQDSAFFYLTGLREPECVLALRRTAGGTESALFVPPKDALKERWEGPMLGVEGALATARFDTVLPTEKAKPFLANWLLKAPDVLLDLGRRDAASDVLWQLALQGSTGRSGGGLRRLSSLGYHLGVERRVKDNREIEALSHSAAIAASAQCEAMRLGRPGVFEHELEACLLASYRRQGAEGPAYEPIVGGGARATFLHYRSNNQRIEAGELVLIDAGCEADGYASDITRTFPVSGRFSAPQRDLYTCVLAAQHAAFAACKPGQTLEAVHQAAVAVLAQGLIDLGVLRGSLEEVIEGGLYRPYYMHQTSHWIGLDVHDPCPYRDDAGEAVKLAPGMVLTVEPGLYFGADVESPDAFAGIGIRIEDDVLITAQGSTILTAAVPSAINAVEALCSEV